MDEFFASLYEWWGLIPFYSTDLGDHLRGYDVTCTDYIDTNWYVTIGWVMTLVTSFVYAFQYHILDSPRFHRRQHWWYFALLITTLNFLIAFAIPFNSIQTEDYCNQLNISVADCVGFGFSNALWSFILFIIITTVPWIRKQSVNCRHTTFWKP